MDFLEAKFIAYLINLAVALSGYPPLPDNYPYEISVQIISHEELITTMCSEEIPELKEGCYKAAKSVRALTDKTNGKIYIDTKLGEGVRKNDRYAKCVLVHEFIHLLQMAHKHNYNPDLTMDQWLEDERQAYRAQMICLE